MDVFDRLTVGEVASLIGGGISLLHIIIPMLWVLVLISVIRDRHFDAVTWSSISHTLQSTSWPLVLQSDGAVGNLLGKKINWRVFFLSQTIFFATLCLIIAHFMTPIPLYEVIQASSTPSEADFTYAPDLSYYGQSMLVQQPLHRRCGWDTAFDCPDSLYGGPTFRLEHPNVTGMWNSSIPQVTLDTFARGSSNSTIAGPADITYRAYIMDKLLWYDDNASIPLGRLESLPMLVLEEKYHLVEGLIVDTFQGGAGIRNHTVPVGLEFGAVWTEDILWIRPQTACTNTNLSLHFSVAASLTSNFSGDLGYLQDEGGFSGIPAVPPEPRWDTEDDAWKGVATDPDLKRQADILAWWNNQFTAWTMNLSTSDLGQIYRGQLDYYARDRSTGAIKISPMDGMHLDEIVYKRRPDMAYNFARYGSKCNGYWDDDAATSGKPFIRCGYLHDVPMPEDLDHGQSWRVDPGSAWKSNLFTCASAVTAAVEQVTFTINGTSSLESLKVLRVDKKNYTAGTEPLWGIERLNSTQFQIWDAYKFWGLIDERHADSPRIDTYRASQMYLPSAVHGKVVTYMYDNFAAGGIFTAVWQSIYEFAAAIDTMTSAGIPNYSGKLNYGLTLKWRELSQQGTVGVEKILNLIWTDIVAFAVAGTRTGFEDITSSSTPAHDTSNAIGSRQVQRYIRKIAYRDIRYAIPAFVSGALCLMPLLLCLLQFCFQRHTWRALNHYMNQTNMGRAATQLMLPAEISVYARTSEWAELARDITLEVPPVPNKRDRSEMKVHRDTSRLAAVVPLKVIQASSASITTGPNESVESQEMLLMNHNIEPVLGRHRSRYRPLQSYEDTW